MTNPTKDAIAAALDSFKAAVKELESMKASIKVLKIAVAAQAAGSDEARLSDILATFERAETVLTAKSHEDIEGAFAVLKHSIWRGSSEPDA